MVGDCARPVKWEYTMPNYNITAKLGDKRNVCLMGLNSKPVTLYAPQWLAILSISHDLIDFIEAHREELSWEKVDADGKVKGKTTRLTPRT